MSILSRYAKIGELIGKSSSSRLILAFVAFIVACSATERVSYENYHLYVTSPKTEAQLQILKQLEESSDSLFFMNNVREVGEKLHVVVAPHKIPDFLSALKRNEVAYDLIEKNLQDSLDKDDKQMTLNGRASPYSWTEYFELRDTYDWMTSLTYDYPGAVTLIEGGKTYEGRSILGVKISKSKSEKPGIFLEAGIHAREWIAPATATYIINQLLTSNDEAIKNLADNYNWYIFPHANPDGYVFTHTTNRLWRKTRTPYGGCYGADPNRNWDFYWNLIGASENPCSDTYAGPSAFSEIETLSLSRYIASIKNKIHLYISFHAYSQYLLYPYGHTGELPANVEDYKKVFTASVDAIGKRYGTKYTGGNIYDAIYPAAGASVDWAFGTQDVKMAFCYELRPSSSSLLTGFRLPASQIIPTGEETLDSITAMIAEVKNLGYFN